MCSGMNTKKTHRVPWSGGIPPCKGEEPYTEEFGPAICMWTPDDWAFDPSFTDFEVEDLYFERFDRHDIEILEQLAVGLDEDGEIIRVGIWGNNETQKRLGQKYGWFETYAHVDKIASGESGWEDFEVYFTHLEGLDLRCRTPMGFHPVRNDGELPEFCLEDWIFIWDCSPIDPDEIDTGAWDTRENFPAHLQGTSEPSQSKPNLYTRPKARSTWNTELGTVLLAPAPDTQLLGFSTTKLQISSHAQQTLKSNRYHELCNLEQQSQARILIFDPYRAQDGRVSDTALVFIQGSPYARHQAVKLLTAFQDNLEKGLMDSNVNFRFLGPGRSRGRKGNGLKKMK
ncbi:uncharacterized protein EAF02_001100 [Botrytis sinoallii]|uniref:uncharacterized protein n=1 Tax=Botrytis sinoallii TaxID=1463999 RepID=UPI0019001A2D|nr:uncharacterized protein EAF02_001100 [Botrytis sinoallii]KAF7893562.1 hypothetical protein EAF02_001100 [Botrytis sinoallii]